MLEPAPRRLTYANVTATLALFIALGGTSYAAFSLPRDSVGSQQIRRGAVGASELRARAVRSSDIAPRAVGLGDISMRARRALRGEKGDPGPPGPPGPAGKPAVSLFAALSSGGVRLRGNAVRASHTSIGFGYYTVAFAHGVSHCVYNATLGTIDQTEAPPGHITVRDDNGEVEVRTYNAAGNPFDLPFHLIVAC